MTDKNSIREMYDSGVTNTADELRKKVDELETNGSISPAVAADLRIAIDWAEDWGAWQWAKCGK